MNKLFRARRLVAPSLVIAIAITTAAAVNGFVGASLAPFAVAVPPLGHVEAPVAAAPSLPALPRFEAFASPVSGEDLSCRQRGCPAGQTCAPWVGSCVDTLPLLPVAPSPDGDCRASRLDVELVATMVASDPDASLAVFRTNDQGASTWAPIGAHVEDREIVAIGRRHVTLRHDDEPECLRVAAPEPRRTERERPRAARTPEPDRTPEPEVPPAPQTLDERIARGVERTDSGYYRVQRAVLDEVLDNPRVLESQAPDVEAVYGDDGRPNGYRLDGVRGVFSAMGARSGDIVRAVDGTIIDSPQSALRLTNRLISRDRVRVTLERRGREITLTYVLE